MNGQGSTSNFFSGNFFVDEGPGTNNFGVVHHNLVPTNTAVCEHGIVPANAAGCDDLMFMGRLGQSSLTAHPQNQVSRRELLNEHKYRFFLSCPCRNLYKLS